MATAGHCNCRIGIPTGEVESSSNSRKQNSKAGVRLLKLFVFQFYAQANIFVRFEALTAELRRFLPSGIRIFQTTRRHIAKDNTFHVLSWHLWIRETAAGKPHAWVLTLWAPKTAVATPWPADKLRRTLLHRVVYLNPVPRGCFQECHLCGFTAFLKKAWYFCVLLPLVYIERSSVPRGIDRGSGTCRRSGINIYDRVVNYIA